MRISLSSPSEIINALREHESVADILVVSRGGGDNLEIFDNPSIAEASLTLSSLFLTAIGHKENISLLQKVADKAFITPTALGQYLNDIYNETVEQLQNSKAKLIDDISRQFKANYDRQIQTLNEKLKATEELHERAKEGISSNYQKEIELEKRQIHILNEQYANQLEQLAKLNEEKALLANTQIQQLKRQLAEAQSSPALNWAFIVLAMLLGLLIGKGCN